MSDLKERLRPRVAELEKEVADTVCTWIEDESGEYWETGCGEAFSITSGTPSDNKMRYCCYCGKMLVEKSPIDDAIDAAMREGGG